MNNENLQDRNSAEEIATFIFYQEWEEHFALVPKNECLDLMMAIFAYAGRGENPTGLSPIAQSVFLTVRNSIDWNRKKFTITRKMRSEWGKQGGRPRKEKVDDESVKGEKGNLFSEKVTFQNEKDTFLEKKDTFSEEKVKKLTVTVTDTVTDTDTVTGSETETDSVTETVTATEGGMGGDFNDVKGKRLGVTQSQNQNFQLHEPKFPAEKIRELWNATCTALPPVRGINGNREKTLRARWNEHHDIDWWKEFFNQIAASDFLNGRSTNWKASFDWCIKPANMDKILEGNYVNKEAKKSGSGYTDEDDNLEQWYEMPDWDRDLKDD